MVFEYDYHVHTIQSYCHEGDLTIDNLIKLAEEKGIKGFAITDHAHHLYFDNKSAWKYEYILNYNLFLELIEVKGKNFESYLKTITNYKKAQNGIKILAGTEVDVAKNGKLIFDHKYIDRLDLLIGGVHWLPCLRYDFSYKDLLVEFMDFTMMLMEHSLTILAHPTRIFRANRMEVPQEVVKPIVQKAKEKNIAIEINSHNYPDPDIKFIRACIGEGVKLSLGTDTHRIAEFGDFSIQKRLLKEAGICDDIIDSIIFKISGEDHG
ncbi:MAG: PHP domain-containing protein [bacterium]